MKLKKINVGKLFGMFNHEIAINSISGITIIIGENGLGKTVLLEMIEAFFKGKYYYFKHVVFDEIIFEFDDGISWNVKKEEKKDSPTKLLLTQLNKKKKQYKPLNLFDFESKSWQFHGSKRRFIEHRIPSKFPFLTRVGNNIWEDNRTGRIIHIDELALRSSQPNLFDFQDNEELPKWFIDRHKKINVSLIETQRLISIEGKEEKSLKKAVEKYSAELTNHIKSLLTESTELSSKLDRTYPNRLVERLENSTNVSDTELNKELLKLEKKRKLLDTVGLIEIEKDSNILEIDNPQNVVKDVLMLYVEDSFEKIKIFDQIAEKINILLNIINKRFKHKKLFIDKEEGFLFRSKILLDKNGKVILDDDGEALIDEDGQGKVIDLKNLSSGEQNELVLFYLLLFKTESNSLILIDEPEVSLHISWQNSFIEDLKEITKLNGLDVVIATHSPDIIGNNWDLKVELTGLE